MINDELLITRSHTVDGVDISFLLN